jgi:hypothetical protein
VPPLDPGRTTNGRDKKTFFQAPQRGGVRPPRQVDGGWGNILQTQGLLRPAATFAAVLPGCLPPNVRRQAPVERWRQAFEKGGVRLPGQAEAGGTFSRHKVSGDQGCCALPPHFPRCSLGAFRLSPVRSDARVASFKLAAAVGAPELLLGRTVSQKIALLARSNF